MYGGDPVIVPEDVRVTIDCGPLIDIIAAEIGIPPIVRWYQDGTIIRTGCPINIIISDDGRLCSITDTVLGVGSQIGPDNSYTCNVSIPTDYNYTVTVYEDCGE